MQLSASEDLDLTAALADTLGRALLLVDAEGEVFFANQQFSDLTGLHRSDLIGRADRAVDWGRTVDRDGRQVQPDSWPVTRTLRHGERVTGEPIGFIRDDETTWVTITSIPVRDRHDPARRAALVLLDIVAAPQPELLSLGDSQAMLASAFDSSPVAMVVATVDGAVLQANAAFEALCPAATDTRSLAWWSFIDHNDRTALFEQLATLRQDPAVAMHLECRGTNAEGDAVVVQISGAAEPRGRALAGEHDGGTRVSVQIADVTALRQSEMRFRTLTETVPIGIYELDTEGRFTHVTPLMQTLTRATESLIGRNAWEFIHPLDRERAHSNYLRTLEGHSWAAEHRIVTADGEEMTVLAAGRPIIGGHGAVTGTLGTIVDFTEYVRLRERLEDLDRDYESLAAQQARERLEAQLAQAQRFETLGRLAGGVAHDFNNLLGVISNYAGFLSKRPDLPPALHHDVEQISEAARRGAELTRQLLLFSRREQLRPQRFDLSRVLGELGALMTRPLRPLIELSIDAEPNACIEADQGQIEQMVLNLLINARDALPNGGHIIVTARRVQAEGAGSRVVLQVADNGIGMAAEVRNRVFEPFFTTKPRSEASGLGLATVQGIVEQAGGRVSIASTLGEGTTVTVSLPSSNPPPS